jgi:hypothetical protein
MTLNLIPQGARMTKSISTCFALAIMLLAFTSCGGSNPAPTPTPTAPTAGVFTVTETPNPIIATGGTQGFQFTAAFTLTVTESAGLGGNVSFVNVTLRNATTGVEVGTIQFNPVDIAARAGSSHIAARGTLSIPLSVVYTLALGGRQATTTIAVQIGDDAGHVSNQLLTVPIV